MYSVNSRSRLHNKRVKESKIFCLTCIIQLLYVLTKIYYMPATAYSKKHKAHLRVSFCFLFLMSMQFVFVTSLIAQRKRNIIFMLGDDIGYKTLSVNGSKLYSTPTLDSLASQGINFTQCHSTPLRSPSRLCCVQENIILEIIPRGLKWIRVKEPLLIY